MNETTKPCPLCAEDIPQAASECPYCGARFKISSDGYCLKCHAFRQADESGNCQTCGEPVADWRLESTFIGEALEVTPPATPPAIQTPPDSAPAAKAARMGNCDVCNRSITWEEGTAYTADEFRTLVRKGFEPPATIQMLGPTAVQGWKNGLVAKSTTGWLLCPDCARQAARYLPKAAAKPARWWIFVAVLAGLLVVAGLGWFFIRMTSERFLSQAPVATPSQTSLLSGQSPATNPTPLPTLTQVMTPSMPPTLAPTNMPALGIGSSMVSEVDGMTLLYVPTGEFLMGSTDDENNPPRTVNLDAFWIDQTEVTNAMYAKCVAAGVCRPPGLTSSASRPAYYDSRQFEDYPVVRVDFSDAETYCRWAGRQLPTGEQWEKAARGDDGRTYPWGNQAPTCELANGNSCLGDTNKVGSYPAGASPYVALDMAGNVDEWVNENITVKYSNIRGGDFIIGAFPVWIGYALAGPAFTVGFRCAAPAEQVSAAPAMPAATPTSAPSALDIGKSMVSDQDGMTLLYVPAGEFLMGSTEKESKFNNERPQHMVYLDAFWIDQTEVTNAQYSQCVSAGKCPPPSGTKTRTHKEYFTNPEFAQHPVVFISWEGANAYCAWAGRRLPTEAEWEKAARGVDRRMYAWGNTSPTCELASWGGTGRCGGDTRAVGSAPDGASPYGALDMTGNAWEWVQDWYSPLYYAKSPAENPGGPSSGQDHVLRGGSWGNAAPWLYVTYRSIYNNLPNPNGDVIGFRCAMSADETPLPQSAQPAGSTASSASPGWVAAFSGPILENIANRPPNFKDDISDEKNSRYFWGSDPGITFTDGVLHLSTTGNLDTQYGRVNNDTPDFVLEMDMTPISISPDGGVHVIFRHSDQGYYALGFYQDGSWEIGYSDNSSGEHTVASGNSDQLGIGKETRVTLIVQDEEMALYLNGLPVGFGSNKALLANNLTFSLNAPSGTTTVDIDNVKFWNLNKLYPKSP